MYAHFIAQILIFLLHLPGYLNISTFYERHKINKRSVWPWKRENWNSMKLKTIYNIVVNQFLIYPVITFGGTLMGINLGFGEFPTLWELFWQFFFVFLIEDLIFFLVHWYSHVNKSLYKMHKVHHEYDTLYTPVTEYFHPFDYVLALVRLLLCRCLLLFLLGF